MAPVHHGWNALACPHPLLIMSNGVWLDPFAENPIVPRLIEYHKGQDGQADPAYDDHRVGIRTSVSNCQTPGWIEAGNHHIWKEAQ